MRRGQEIERLEQQQVSCDTEIKSLQAQFHNIDPKLRERYEQKIKLLDEKWHRVGERLAELRLREAESWEEDHMLTGLHEVFDDIGRRVDELISKLSGRAVARGD